MEPGKIATTTSTPLHTKDWYVKWVASVILLVGMILTAQNIYPINLFVNITGLIGWLIVAIMWNDRALIIINAVGVSIYANGIVTFIMDFMAYESF
tara:strand:+ start:370 stop:657 length:288 start_codon:yes stop_codon:yes gene_type:complete